MAGGADVDAARIPPRTPPAIPAGTPPGTPPMTPTDGATDSSTIFAISLGMMTGDINASGATGRTGCATGPGAATTGISTGGGGGGGGGPIGETSVTNSSRSGMVCGMSSGTMMTANMSKPWNNSEPSTDGLLYLSFSGNVAGRS